MIKKSFLTVALLFTLVFFNGCMKLDPNNGDYSLVVPISDVNSAIQTRFPLDKKTEFGTLHLSNPSIVGSSVADDKLQIKLKFNLSNFLIPSGIEGSLILTSSIKYDKKTKKLYLKNPLVDSLIVEQSSLTKLLTPTIKKEMSIFVEEVVKYYPIYDLKKATIASGFVKDITIKGKDLYLDLGL
jgi:hypothetical protein